ncbi:DUF378 domain-containing protein [Massilia solisilvae]|uniref:DUF378 domain-containing protein n=1 Tax=Massilia solisilvae TaxID=1811225 RepID=A0ABT2BIA5_9BURK|nr:DUF378 domain-containing protein [Massilia solisilvae]MCS0607785.1 DUF378 domain-containing protein [Massilia solisilvae]
MATMNAPTIDRRQMPERRVALREGRGSVMSALDYIAMALLIIGGLNWGMIGISGIDVVASVFGADSAGSRLVYTLVGLAALYSIYLAAKMASTRRL